MTLDFERRIAIVTGAASGIGRALAARLCELGAEVVLADTSGSDVKAAASELKGQDYLATGVQLDVRDEQAFVDLALAVHQKAGRIDFLFNCAAVTIIGEVRDFQVEDWHDTLDVNLKGPVHGIHAVYPLMVNQGSGHIVNMASLAGLVPAPMMSAYSASMFGLVGLSLSLRAEASDLGVNVSVVCPGFIESRLEKAERRTLVAPELVRAQMEDLGSVTVEDCVEAAIRAVTREKALITVPASAGAGWRLQRLFPSAGGNAARNAVRRLRDESDE